MLVPTLIQDRLCRISTVRYAVVVKDRNEDQWIAAVVPWIGLSVDTAQCLKAIAELHSTVPIFVVPLNQIPLTEQGKPDRTRSASSDAKLPTSTVRLAEHPSPMA